MRSASEKLAIIRLVEDSELSVRRTLAELKISRSSFYRWHRAYERGGSRTNISGILETFIFIECQLFNALLIAGADIDHSRSDPGNWLKP
jgi:hypothetical protein